MLVFTLFSSLAKLIWILKFINKHRIERNVSDFELKVFSVVFFSGGGGGADILDIYSSSISDSAFEEEQELCCCEKLMFSIEHERSDQTPSASPSTLIL